MAKLMLKGFSFNKESVGMRPRQKTNLPKYIALSYLATLPVIYIVSHGYGWVAKNPTLSLGEGLTKWIESLNENTMRLLTYPANPLDAENFSNFCFILEITVTLIWAFAAPGIIRSERLMLANSAGSMHFNNDYAAYNSRFTDPAGSPKNDGPRNVILTDKIFMSMNTRQTRRNLNLLVIGGSGSGKSRFLVKPNLCQSPINCCFIVTDPSGENMADCAQLLEDMGTKVKCFNLDNMKLSDRYNPLQYIHTENDVILLTDCLVTNTSDQSKKGGDDFWVKAIKLMTQSFIFLLWLHGDELGLEKNMNSVMDLLDGCFLEQTDDEDADSGEVQMTLTDKYFAMVQYGYAVDPATNKPLVKDGDFVYGDKRNVYPNAKGVDISIRQYRKFKSSGQGKAFQNMLLSASTQYAAFETEDVKNLLATDTVDLESIAYEKTVLFVTLPQDNDSFNFLAAMLYSQLFQTLYYNANNNCRGNYIVRDARGENVRIYEVEHAKLEEAADEEELINDLEDDSIEEVELSLETGKEKKTLKGMFGGKKKKSKADNDTENAAEEEIAVDGKKCTVKEQRKKDKARLEKQEKRALRKVKRIEHKEQFNSLGEVMDCFEDLQKAMDKNDATLEVETDPGEEDLTIEKKAEQFVEDLKNVRLSKKGSHYIIRCVLSETGEDTIIGVYGNEKYARERATALKNSRIERCGLHLPNHVRFMLDEFANIGKIPMFPMLLSTMRKYEISATVVLQSLSQLKEMYEKEWGTVVGNCDAYMLLGTNDLETQEYTSKKLGKGEVDTRSSSVNYGTKGGHSLSTSAKARELMMPEELGMLGEDECILIVRGVYPFREKKYVYENHPNYHLTAEATGEEYRFSPKKKNYVELTPIYHETYGAKSTGLIVDSTAREVESSPVSNKSDASSQYIEFNDESSTDYNRIHNDDKRPGTGVPMDLGEKLPPGYVERRATQEDIDNLMSDRTHLITTGARLEGFLDMFDDMKEAPTEEQKEEAEPKKESGSVTSDAAPQKEDGNTQNAEDMVKDPPEDETDEPDVYVSDEREEERPDMDMDEPDMDDGPDIDGPDVEEPPDDYNGSDESSVLAV